jgi:Cu2+-exporting ATPase
VECQQLAAGLESVSEHPVARAILKLGVTPTKLQAISIESGRGVKGYYAGQEYRIGNLGFVQELVQHDLIQAETSVQGSCIYLGKSNQWLAGIRLADEVRPEAAKVIQELHQLGIHVSVLSGDANSVVQSVAQQLNIDTALGEQLPDGKLAYLKQLQAKSAVVAMVGDGVNDAPVLAGAQVSIAMGSGSQLAQASADMVLLSENLHQLPFAVQTARRMQTIIKQNFVWTIGYNLLAIPLAASGLVAPWMAAIGMSASSLIVVLNALRLKS